MELGIDSFAVTLPDPETGRSLPAAERMARLLAEVEVADRAGLDVFGIGEHHRADSSMRLRPSSSRPRRHARAGSD